MSCIKWTGRPSKIKRLEQTAMKNGFRPGVHEKHGFYIGQWVNDVKQGKGKKMYKDNTIYEGDWVANKRHGFGVLMRKVGDHYEYVYEGHWIYNRFVLVALNFFGTGSYQLPVSNSHFMSQSLVSRCVKEVVLALNHPNVFKSWVKFPSNMHELTVVRNEFYRKTGFPGVIGCLDCTHIAIVPPSKNLNLQENQYPEYIYINRKGYHSINVQLAKGKWYEKNGIYEGTFSGNKVKCGYGTMWWNDGAVYRGHWRNNGYDGRGRHSEGKIWDLAYTIYPVFPFLSLYVKSLYILKIKANRI